MKYNPGSFIQFSAKKKQILLLRYIIFFAPKTSQVKSLGTPHIIVYH